MPRPKLTLEEITRAAGEAGIDDESVRQEFARKVYENLAANRVRIGRPPGRPPEKDEKELLAIARLMLKGTNPHAAVKQVTANLPESKRKAALQRLYKKIRKDPDLWLSKAAALPTTIREEIERLREQLGPIDDRLDFGQFIRRIQRDPEF
ncbi:MAG TPA: hypothetical protein VEW48_14170 [Thermoanaerobaculia bacterium]|nr:hypothetical protein [Thermoanaerobaculia bacterium]